MAEASNKGDWADIREDVREKMNLPADEDDVAAAKAAAEAAAAEEAAEIARGDGDPGAHSATGDRGDTGRSAAPRGDGLRPVRHPPWQGPKNGGAEPPFSLGAARRFWRYEMPLSAQSSAC